MPPELSTLDGELTPVRTPGHEAAAQVAFALLDALWAGPVGLAVFDADLRFLQVNEALARITGRPAEAHAGRTLVELFDGAAGRPPMVTHIEEALRSVIATGRPRLNAVVARVDRAGSREWLCSYYPVSNPLGGAPRGVCAVITDATDDRDREQALRQSRDDAAARARRLALLQDTTAALSAAVDPAAVGEVVVEKAREALGAANATLRVLVGERLEAIATRGDVANVARAFPSIPVDADAPPAVAVRRHEAVWLESPEVLRERFPGFAGELAPALSGAWVVVPLAVHGRVLGSLGFTFQGPRTFDLEERAFVLSFAEQVAQALDRARLLEEERARRALHQRASERVALVQRVTAALSQARTAEDVASVLVLQAHEALAADAAAAWARGESALELLAGLGLDPGVRAGAVRIPLDAPSPAAEAARSAAPLWFASREEQLARFPALATAPLGELLPALAAVPLRCAGEVLGVATFSFRDRRALGSAERELLVACADLCGQALERARLFDRERAARAAEARARALLDAVLENAPVGIGFWDREGRFALLNRRLAEINGLPVEAHLGKTIAEVLPRLPVDALEVTFRAVLEEGRTVLEEPVAGETPAEPGKARHWLSSYYPVRAGGEIVGVGGIVREVTAQREAEEFQRNVLGIVGHDLRNPLGALVLSTRLLDRHAASSPPEVAALVERIRRAADRMDSIIAVLLDYTRVRGGQAIPIRPAGLSLESLVATVVEECRAARPGREIRFGAEGEGAGRWDRDRIGQVVQNLVSNALDHGAPGEPVLVTFRGLAREVEVAVRNAGPPIPRELLPRLFDPFRRAESSEPHHQGLGLGLFIARAIVEAHGGRIGVRSSPDEGTVFMVRLPRWVEAQEPGSNGFGGHTA